VSTAVEVILGTILDDLTGCLCSALEDTAAGAPCFCGIVGGQQAIADHCSCDGNNNCGQAWVRVDRIYPYDTNVATAARTPTCTSPLAALIEVGVYRCIPTARGNGSAPDAVALANQALRQVSDAGAMAQAISCCESIRSRSHVLGTYTPRDSGDCGGGVWPVTVAISRGRA